MKAYSRPPSPPPHYKPIVEEKTEIVAKDVNKAWKELYDRQAPLLTWPETVQDRFQQVGPAMAGERGCRQGPAGDRGLHRSLSGLRRHGLSRPSTRSTTRPARGSWPRRPRRSCCGRPRSPWRSMPDLGKVWAAQERLWIQRTLLEVVPRSTRTPRTGIPPSSRRSLGLEVGNPWPRTSVSLAKGQQLKQAAGDPRTRRRPRLRPKAEAAAVPAAWG